MAVPHRVFLGWEPDLLARAARWIVERHGPDLSQLLVALPGGRAARAMREHLARRVDPATPPPRVLTQGELTDELVRLDRPVAGRLARTLAWAEALRELSPAGIEALTARPPGKDDLRGWIALAETVRALHAELAPEGLGFDRVAGEKGLPGGRGEALRWRALAQAQEAWRAGLAALGLADPHESRFAAIEAGRVEASKRVVLVGVADANRLLRRALEKLGERVTVLVFAPQEEAQAFDELGCARTGAWKDRDLDLSPDRWHVVEGPAEQAERAVAILAGHASRFAAEEISIGVCDEEVAPFLERRLAEEGVLARHAAGTPLGRTRPFRLLADLAAWLPRRGFAAYAALLRHPDLEAAIRGGLPGFDPAALDDYQREHLPASADGFWLGREGEALRAPHAKLLELLGQLASEKPRALAGWPGPVRAFLESVCSDDLDREKEDERALVESLSALSAALGELDGLPGSLGAHPTSAAEALELALDLASDESVPPRRAAEDEAAIELLGWLELPLDEAPVLVVTGFNEGFVPRSRRGDAFLPDALRRRLELPCADDRVGRDLFAATLLLHSRRELAFVSGRRTRDGEPLLPSRLAFHRPAAELPARVERLQAVEPPRSPAIPAVAPRHELPRLSPLPRPARMRVTAFGDYLRSPYGFYLRHVLEVGTLDDAGREMDPRASGTLAHRVLEDLGRSDLRDSTDARAVEGFLRERLDERARATFGTRPLPAVLLQVEQLGRRLALFARVHAGRAAEGWRVQAVEWQAPGTAVLEMGAGEALMPLTGKIDRIDRHEKTGAWAILDYKTGLEAKDPRKVHLVQGEWRDLQLPLYVHVARPLVGEAVPVTGYLNVGRDEQQTDVRTLTWERGAIDGALDAAREVVRRVRRGEFFDLGRLYGREPILQALAGRGLVAAAQDDGDDAEEVPA